MVVAFGQILPESLFTAVPLGFVNVHFSLLPRWRGAAPVERAILAGDAETGVCIMAIAKGLDTGDVYARVATPIAPDETAGELRDAARRPRHGPAARHAAATCRRSRPSRRPASPPTPTSSRSRSSSSTGRGPADELAAGDPRRQSAAGRVDDRRRQAPQDPRGDDRRAGRARAARRATGRPRAQMSFDEWVRGRHGKPYEFGT